ncbi:oncostatin-M-specific receptor subunit beta [Oreochromis niloticus]|uniref:oncostatin-M-specific receptor subunit beta n=1 Tax=Oreochromis niloticus TaxID=8128 RepID=UPI000904B1E9|nr:oncostatin-M-specific receptor subunit beta [Oreochromis niloticus]CAI5666185.1 unnamed protein product [Mustela putorius furo]
MLFSHLLADAHCLSLQMRMIMISWLLLLSLFRQSTQDGQGDGVLRCGPQNVTLDYDSFLLKWEDDPSCSVIRDGLVYELQLLTADKPVHNGEVVVTPAQIGSTHSWKWTSHLPSQCARHSVRLRSQYNNQSSPWMQKMLPDQGEILVLPRDQIFKVGSTATFCCTVPDGESIKMFLPNYKGANVNATKISEHVHSLTVHLDQESENWSDVICETTKGNINGASFHASYPPDDSDLQCETRDLESIDCFWNVGRAANEHPAMERIYQLQGSPCINGHSGKCSQKVEVDTVERNWTLTATNRLGKLELCDRANLTKRVHMVAPEKVAASTVNPRNISLKWSWTVQKYSNLNLTCQVDVSDGDSNTKVFQTENFGVGLTAAVIKDLIPHWDYDVRVRCGTAQHFWKWGDWSKSVKIRTKGDVARKATNLIEKNLNISSYTFMVNPQTTVLSNSVTLNPPTYLTVLTMIALGAVFIILSICTILCYRHRVCIKHKVHSPIPKPVLTDKWLISPNEHAIHHHHFGQSHYSEVMDVPELHDNVRPLEPVGSQDLMYCTFSPSSKDDYNRLLQKPLPCPTLPTEE